MPSNRDEPGPAKRLSNPRPKTTMNSSHSPSRPVPQYDDEPLRIREVAAATVIVVAACASVAVAFTAIATTQVAGMAFQRIFKRGGLDVPRH